MAGDVVVCVRARGVSFLRRNEVYDVVEVNPAHPVRIRVKRRGEIGQAESDFFFYSADRFELDRAASAEVLRLRHEALVKNV